MKGTFVLDAPSARARSRPRMSLRDVAWRRVQLLIVSSVVVLATGSVFAVSQIRPNDALITDSAASILRWSALAVLLAFAMYAVEKEIHLRRVASLLENERLLSSPTGTSSFRSRSSS